MGARSTEMPLPKPKSALADGTDKIRPAMNVRTRSRRARRAMFRAMICRIPGFAPICCDTNDPETQADGMRKRLMRDLPVPDPIILQDFAAFVRAWLIKHVDKAPCRMTLEEWLDQTNYSEGRKAEIRAASELCRGGRPNRHEAMKVKSFGKTESYAVYKFLRWINSRSDKVKAWFGPLMKSVESIIYKLRWFIKHVSVPDRPGKLSGLARSGLRYFLSDFTAFESHFTPEIMNSCEMLLYRHVLGFMTEDEADFMQSVLTGQNRLRTRQGVFATVKGRRMSGDMCTSIGNGFTNLMLAMYLANKKGVDPDDFLGYVEGDDGIFALPIELNAEDYKPLGWTIKIREVEHPCTMIPLRKEPEDPAEGMYFSAFCGIVCSEDGDILRDPRSFLANFGWTSSCVHAGDKVLKELQRAKALSAVYETPNCPIVGALARKALELTRGCVARFVDDGFHYVPRDEGKVLAKVGALNPSLATRELFSRLFGISPEVQVMIEERFAHGNFNVMDLVAPNSDTLHYEARFVEVG